jgi:hypothetical protein
VLGACWPLTMFWETLGPIDLFWDFDNLSKEEQKTKRRSQDIGPFLGHFWIFRIMSWDWDVSPWVYPCLGLFCNI